jgi:hypothetical protein
MRTVSIIVLALLASVPGLAGAQSKPVVGKGWTLDISTDPMTDAKNCVATINAKYIQLTPSSFAVSYRSRGGIEGYTLRLDDRPAEAMRLPTRVEKQVGAFVINDTDPIFAEMIAARRLRIQTLTLISGLANDDIDMSGAADAIAKMRAAGCK